MIYTTQVLPDHVTDSQSVGPRDFDQAKPFLEQFAPAFSNTQLLSIGISEKQDPPVSQPKHSQHLGVLCAWILSFLKGPQLNPFTHLKCSHSRRPQRILFSIGNLTLLKPFHFA